MKELSKEFLLSRGKCCYNQCKNCPYNPPKTPKICQIISRYDKETGIWSSCRKKATRHNGLTWLCAECYEKHYGK